MMAFFIGPTIGATAESGQAFLGHLMNKMKLSSRIAASAGLSILAGFALFWIDSSGFTSSWLTSGAGIGFTIGSLSALVGFIFGMLVGRTNKTMAKLGAEFQGKPSPEQMMQLQALQKKQATYGAISTPALIIAALFMAIARYIVI